LEIEHREGAQCNLLHVFNELLMSFRPDDEDMQVTRSTFVFNRFMDLLAVNYKKEHEVQFYAQELCMTPKYFSKIVTDVTGRGANAWINEYITNKAKNMLRTRPDLTLHEIGNMLGFSEQAAFTRFFHKQTGFSPRSFRG
ncbi:MAG: AraC family transcriptional regulator, partial [Paludibacteraceae bacterium]|nr:AraC family transcriptional regulator [Paludibacteraceae bacterium]